MKIAICSDVHLEFGPLEIKNTEQADVLILSGDICVNAKLLFVDSVPTTQDSNKVHKFFSDCSREFKTVIYVAGNHEHYHGDFAKTIPELKSKLAYLDNIVILDKETLVIDDVCFIGGTLWTDMNKEDPLTLYHIRRMMNDFRCVENSDVQVTYRSFGVDPETKAPTEVVKFHTRASTFSPEHAVEDHKKMLAYIKSVYDNGNYEKYVVVGHHTPSAFSCHPKYSGDTLMNGGYHSDLIDFILDRPKIILWTHGHTHEHFDYPIGNCGVFCNPRGYIGYEEMADTFALKYVELP